MEGLTTGKVSTAITRPWQKGLFLFHFNDMFGYQQPGKAIYSLDEILLLCLPAILAGAEAFTDIARFGEKKLDLLRRFRPYKDGTLAVLIRDDASSGSLARGPH